MRLTTPVFRLKRHAKALASEAGIPLHAALDRIARREGFQNWSHLASAAEPVSRAGKLLNGLASGSLALLAARPGQGKTVLGLELLLEAVRAGRPAAFFTLEYTAAQTREWLARLGGTPEEVARVQVDATDEICADHVIASLSGLGSGAFAVVDYLQILDQPRSRPELAVQTAALHAYARQSGTVIALLSQITRAFDSSGSKMPGFNDLRLPNPLDVSLFGTACFLQDGEIRIESRS